MILLHITYLQKYDLSLGGYNIHFKMYQHIFNMKNKYQFMFNIYYISSV